MNTDVLSDRTILILEDEPATCQLFEVFFKGVCEVDVAAEPEEALEQAGREQYDLAILDVHLKHEDLDGPTVLKRLRAMDGYDDVPAVAATAHAMPGDEERFLADGFDGYISKPFTRDSLLTPVVRLLDESADA